MFGKLFKKSSLSDKTLSNISEILPNIEQLSLTSQLIKMSIERIQQAVGKNISTDSQYCIYSFELGAMQHALKSLCDLSVFDSQQRFMFLIYAIFYNEVKNEKITSDAAWEILANDYHRACSDKFKAFRQFGFDSNFENSSRDNSDNPSSEHLTTKLIQQLEADTHILTKSGSIKKGKYNKAFKKVKLCTFITL
jgi:hypothetical protein